MDARRTLEEKVGREFVAELLTALEFNPEDEDLLWALCKGEEWAQKKFFMQGGMTEAGAVQPSFIRIGRFMEYLQSAEQSPLPSSMPARATFQTLVGPEEFAKILAHFAAADVRLDSKLYDRFLACLRVTGVPPDYDSVHASARRFAAVASGSDEAEYAMKSRILLAAVGDKVATNELLLFRGKKVLESVLLKGKQAREAIHNKKPLSFWGRFFGR